MLEFRQAAFIMEEEPTELAKLKKEREYWRTKILWLSLEIAFIFAIPAFTALVVGKWLMRSFETGNGILFVLLAIAFVVSWIGVILRYRSIKKKLDFVDEEISKHSDRG